MDVMAMYEIRLKKQYQKWTEISKIRSEIKKLGDRKRDLEAETRSIGQQISTKIEEFEKMMDAYDKTW